MWKVSTGQTWSGVPRVVRRRSVCATATSTNGKKNLVANRLIDQLDELLRRHVGIGFGLSILLPLVLAIAGVAVGTLFPKFEATALLQFPEAQKSTEKQGEPRALDQRPVDPKANVIELAAFKRVAASYDSAAQLGAYLRAAGLIGRSGAERLLVQAESQSFWDRVATPVLPFSRRDQKEFGDIKDASATTMLGLELVADARTESIAHSMVELLAGYYVNAVVRERIRAWVLAGKVDSQSLEKSVRADILRAELDIELSRRRAEDMKAILARYPDAARMDSRQVVSVNPSEGGERYLSPLAQLVGAESAISQRQEMIRRWQRELKQKSILATFYASADDLLKGEVEVTKLLSALKALASTSFSHAEAEQEWNREAAFRVNGALDNFEVMRSQFGVRNGIRTGEVASRTPLRLALLGAVAGLIILMAIAFTRAALQVARGEDNAAAVAPGK